MAALNASLPILPNPLIPLDEQTGNLAYLKPETFFV
jgi:hypothetical protein